MADASFEIVKSVTSVPTQEENEEFKQNANATYSYYNQNGGSAYEPTVQNYLDQLITHAPITITPPPSTPPSSSGGSNLLDNLKNNTNATTKALNDIAKVLHESNKVSEKNVQAIQTMGANIKNVLGGVAQVLAMSNNLKDVSNQIQNHHSRYQTAKNIKQIDQLDFEKNGRPELVDSHGNHIVPREGKARFHTEKAIDEEKMNKFNWGNMLDGVESEGNAIINEGSTLLGDIINAHKLSSETIKKIDDEVKKINWGDSNGNQ